MIVNPKRKTLNGRLPQVREEQDVIDKFMEYCHDINVSASDIIRAIIRDIINGKITIGKDK